MHSPRWIWTWLLALALTVAVVGGAPRAWADDAEGAEEDAKAKAEAEADDAAEAARWEAYEKRVAERRAKDEAQNRDMYTHFRLVTQSIHPDAYTFFEGAVRGLSPSVELETQPELFQMFSLNFYRQRQMVERDAAKPLLKILLDPTMFSVYTEPYPCYDRPDYAVVIVSPRKTYHFLISLRCRVMMIATLPDRLLVENPGLILLRFPEETQETLRAILEPMEKSRVVTRARDAAVRKAEAEAAEAATEAPPATQVEPQFFLPNQ